MGEERVQGGLKGRRRGNDLKKGEEKGKRSG